jgi:hypothetical protein
VTEFDGSRRRDAQGQLPRRGLAGLVGGVGGLVFGVLFVPALCGLPLVLLYWALVLGGWLSR